MNANDLKKIRVDILEMVHTAKESLSSFSLPFIFLDASKKKALEGKLKNAKIESRPIVSGNLLRQPFLERYQSGEDFEDAEHIRANGFYIGNNQFVGQERLGRLKSLLKEFFVHV